MVRAWSSRPRDRRGAALGRGEDAGTIVQRTSDLTADDVRLVYDAVLGRAADEAEIAAQLATGDDLRALLRAVATSAERRQRLADIEAALAAALEPRVVEPVEPRRPDPPRRLAVNVHTDDLGPFGIPPGTWSDDEAAVVGHDGWLFLGRGNNLVLAQYRGEVDLPDDWMALWTDGVAIRRAGAAAIGAAFLGVVVPDKLTVLRSSFPEPLPADATPPAARLAAERDLGLVYPVEEVRAVPGGAFLRTDTHLTYEGNLALARAVGSALGVEVPDRLDPARARRDLISGDLGSRFEPAVVEVAVTAGDLGAAELVESNHAEIAAVGGHIGIRQVLRGERAPDPRTVVVFGDSYAFCAPTFQGLSWFLAQVFREVHFLWVPFGWDPDYAAAVGADVVVCECAERFVVRPPLPRVDVGSLADQTIARRRGITPEELMS